MMGRCTALLILREAKLPWGAIVFEQLFFPTIHLFPKWRPINYSFVCMLISPLGLVIMNKKQKNFEVKMRQRGLIKMQTKE